MSFYKLLFPLGWEKEIREFMSGPDNQKILRSKLRDYIVSLCICTKCGWLSVFSIVVHQRVSVSGRGSDDCSHRTVWISYWLTNYRDNHVFAK